MKVMARGGLGRLLKNAAQHRPSVLQDRPRQATDDHSSTDSGYLDVRDCLGKDGGVKTSKLKVDSGFRSTRSVFTEQSGSSELLVFATRRCFECPSFGRVIVRFETMGS